MPALLLKLGFNFALLHCRYVSLPKGKTKMGSIYVSFFLYTERTILKKKFFFPQVLKPNRDVQHHVFLPQTSKALQTVTSIVPKNSDITHIQPTAHSTMFACSVELYWKVALVVLCTVMSYKLVIGPEMWAVK